LREAPKAVTLVGMNVGLSLNSSLISQAATSVADSPGAAQILALRKALQLQQHGAMALLQALPQPAPTRTSTGELPLAGEGPLGTRLNVIA